MAVISEAAIRELAGIRGGVAPITSCYLDVDGRRLVRHQDVEHELQDTGAFEGDRYFDVMIEWAKNAPDDIALRVTVTNRGPEADRFSSVPQLSELWSTMIR